MKAMIFAAGLGTRFKPWTDEHPKALAIVNGKSLLQRNVEYLRQYGIKDVVVNVHHFADQIVDAIEKANGWGSTITISDESNEVLETGGGLLKAKNYLAGESFLTINVDILTDVNLTAFISYHQQQSADITLGVTNRTTSRYLLFNENSRLCGWRNISTGAERISFHSDNYIQKAYSGLALFEPSIFNAVKQTGKFSLIDVYLSLASTHKIIGYDHSESRVLDVGKPESVALAESMFP
ncbi:nucleotidyltransferase family protein [Flavisolibacter ginsenosidimutans]|uniref:Nucleotidyltransferase family protein n=1 Tax=Flavisolibacter ginsenosidimutans TaxID=661481 RepID=A0A5B8UML7_9BACT|nr:sugar phosphate nucleotidyltransferase [Flavisolibacter ginsenosidimutans]QEC57818.1 nucleotidyltransferase family protein [Flavisolibacter ginsenosidimutans]